jgi:hypothetical protein
VAVDAPKDALICIKIMFCREVSLSEFLYILMDMDECKEGIATAFIVIFP